MNGLLDMWNFSDEIQALAKERILHGHNLATRNDLTKETVKLALILTRLLNPSENLTEQEEAILAGVSTPTLRKQRARKEFIQVVNR